MNVQVISFNCLLKNKAGRFISSTYNREVLNAVEVKTNMLSGLSKGLQDLKKGELRKVYVSAEEAYGFYDPTKVILYPHKKLSKKIAIGESISIIDKSGFTRFYKVIEFYGDMVSLDGNHPLAGQDLVFEIEVLEARQATKSEIDDSINDVSTQLFH